MGLICWMVFTMLPILALPSAWAEPRGWKRIKAVTYCLSMFIVMLALTCGYVLVIGWAE